MVGAQRCTDTQTDRTEYRVAPQLKIMQRKPRMSKGLIKRGRLKTGWENHGEPGNQVPTKS